jgi:2-dehydropantoate 2-reductase
VRILVFGAGVIGSAYAGRLLQAGHDVVLLARGARLVDLQSVGLILEDAESGSRITLPVTAVSASPPSDRFDLVLVPLRAEQVEAALPMLSGMQDDSDVLFFGNLGDQVEDIAAALGSRALFGFPAVGGTRDGQVIEYVVIRQQKTMLGELGAATTPRLRHLQQVFEGAGFATSITGDVRAWLLGHLAFVVPIAFALYRVGVDPKRLARDGATMGLLVLATREAFGALREAGNREIPRNLRALYRLPAVLVISYWKRVLQGPRGELWFGAHTRAAPAEMHTLARDLQDAIAHTGNAAPHLTRLLT